MDPVTGMDYQNGHLCLVMSTLRVFYMHKNYVLLRIEIQILAFTV